MSSAVHDGLKLAELDTPPADAASAQALGQTFAKFQSLIAYAELLAGKGRFLHAAIVAQIAALHASYNHPGEFSSPRLERLVRVVGASLATAGTREAGARAASDRTVERVLHVLTAAKDVGGDSRFVWRWIRRDPGRQHHVALTQQMTHEIPKELVDAVAAAGGAIHVLDAGGANVLDRARRLRGLAQQADMVALHIYPEDIVPLAAFADRAGIPPVAFVAQADHQYWTGISVSDLIIPLRDSGARLVVERRNSFADCTVPLPIPLEDLSVAVSRSAARQRLGLADDQIVLLSVARGLKYQPVQEPNFADALLPVIERCPGAVLLVVGPAQTGFWEAANARSGGRLRAFGQRSDTADFYRAADIYIDSFPFSSNTSLLEAGLHSLPLVGYCPFAAAEVFGAGAPGMEQILIRTRSLQELRAAISELIDDAALRAQLGSKTRAAILETHCGAGWNRRLESIYGKVAGLARKPASLDGEDLCRSEEIDVLLHRFYSREAPLGWIIGWYARQLPYLSRVRLLSGLLRLDRSFSFNWFLPNRLQPWVGTFMQGWRRWPLIGRLLQGRS